MWRIARHLAVHRSGHRILAQLVPLVLPAPVADGPLLRWLGSRQPARPAPGQHLHGVRVVIAAASAKQCAYAATLAAKLGVGRHDYDLVAWDTGMSSSKAGRKMDREMVSAAIDAALKELAHRASQGGLSDKELVFEHADRLIMLGVAVRHVEGCTVDFGGAAHSAVHRTAPVLGAWPDRKLSEWARMPSDLVRAEMARFRECRGGSGPHA